MAVGLSRASVQGHVPYTPVRCRLGRRGYSWVQIFFVVVLSGNFFFFGICFYLRALIILKNYLVWW